MTPAVFKMVDRRYLAGALSESLSHGGLSQFEVGLGIDTAGGNKDQRATAIIRHIFEKTVDPDAAVIDLLNYLYVEDIADRRMSDSYKTLQTQVLEPRGITLTDAGHQLPTLDSISSKPTRMPMQSDSPLYTADRSGVFVVHGRDTRPLHALRTFLMFAGLKTMTWSGAVKLTGKPQPTTYEVVMAGMQAAAAILVIFSPDDEARLKPALDPEGEDSTPKGQPRQNVLLEAGMAFAASPEKTIFVNSGPTRPISDISGFNWVRMDGTWDSRQDLVNRLRTAGAAVNLQTGNLGDERLAGPFKVAPH